MYVQISSSQAKENLKRNFIIVVEFEENSHKRGRAVLQGFINQSANVKTIYGNVYPKQFYTFRSFAEAQKFINEA